MRRSAADRRATTAYGWLHVLGQSHAAVRTRAGHYATIELISLATALHGAPRLPARSDRPPACDLRFFVPSPPQRVPPSLINATRLIISLPFCVDILLLL